MSTRPGHGAPRPSSRKGFTLIELLIVVVIIGVLAAIAVPKFKSSKGKAFAASLKSDLHNLTTAQESYFYDHSTYAGALSDLRYQGSAGVQISIEEATGRGWLAQATHPAAYPLTCAIYIGTVSAGVLSASPATSEGSVGCDGSPP